MAAHSAAAARVPREQARRGRLGGTRARARFRRGRGRGRGRFSLLGGLEHEPALELVARRVRFRALGVSECMDSRTATADPPGARRRWRPVDGASARRAGGGWSASGCCGPLRLWLGPLGLAEARDHVQQRADREHAPSREEGEQADEQDHDERHVACGDAADGGDAHALSADPHRAGERVQRIRGRAAGCALAGRPLRHRRSVWARRRLRAAAPLAASRYGTRVIVRHDLTCRVRSRAWGRPRSHRVPIARAPSMISTIGAERGQSYRGEATGEARGSAVGTQSLRLLPDIQSDTPCDGAPRGLSEERAGARGRRHVDQIARADPERPRMQDPG